MHELSLVEELVQKCRALAQGRSVLQIWATCPEGTDVDELPECFALLSDQLVAQGDTCLQRAQLNVQALPLFLSCPCGFNGELASDQIAGHITVCPQCSRVGEGEAGMELVAMSFDQLDRAVGPPTRDQVP
jgi:Zn finger protein HypA/HybF involved in hydrogenase expression